MDAPDTYEDTRTRVWLDGLTASGRSLRSEAEYFTDMVTGYRERIRTVVAELHAFCDGYIVTEQPSAVDLIHMPAIDDTLEDITGKAARKVEEDTGIFPEWRPTRTQEAA